MPAKAKTAQQRSKAAKSPRRAPASARTNVDLHAGEGGQVARREPMLPPARGEGARARGVDAMDKAIAKEDAKIIAKASARAIRRGLH
jgi:hypothetical protein